MNKITTQKLTIQKMIEEITEELYQEKDVTRRWWLMHLRDGLQWRELDIEGR